MSTYVTVSVIPPCDICVHVYHVETPEPAYWDLRTVDGRWANVCMKHREWAAYKTPGGSPILGTGMGQRLMVEMPK